MVLIWMVLQKELHQRSTDVAPQSVNFTNLFYFFFLMLQLTKPLAFIDIEATGTNVCVDRIVEIAILKVLPDGNRSVKRKLLNPQTTISQSSIDIHGITNESVKDAPTFKQVAQEIRLSSSNHNTGALISERQQQFCLYVFRN